MANLELQTPCIGICSTVYGDAVCRGCKRFQHEVIRWNGYTNKQKANVIGRLDQLLGQILETTLTITSETRLREVLKKEKIRYHPQMAPPCWAFEIIKAHKERAHGPGGLGFQILPEYRNLSFAKLAELINDRFFRLALAHYEANFLRAFDTPVESEPR